MNRFAIITTLAALGLIGCDTEPDPVDPATVVDTGTPPTVPAPLMFVAPNDPAGIALPDPAAFDYYIGAQFTMDGLLGGPDGVRFSDDPSIICTSGCEADEMIENGTVLYPVDNAFGFDVADYSDAIPRDRDGVHEEGWIGTILDGAGDPMGVAISTVETDSYKVPQNKGSWCAGLNGEPVKCSTEHYVVLEHVKTCTETIPYWFSDPYTGEQIPGYEACEPLLDDLDIPFSELIPDENSIDEWAAGTDYGISLKDDGKPLYRFGDTVKKPTDMRLQLSLPLPEEWFVEGSEFAVTRAELAVVHTISNSPNDQIRPEDWENEGATGRTPGYIVDADGRWLSDKDCYQGDGTFIPEGTVLRNPEWGDPTAISEDLREGFTNAWYRTLDRNPFAWDVDNGKSPRWRLQAPKMGQDLPGFEIPIQNCQPAPLQNGEKLYERGELTTTVIDLLDFGELEAPLATSSGWVQMTPVVTENGLTLTKDFDVSVYIKGEKKPVQLYSAHLFLDYEPVAP
jgi:hypothetical protein